MSSTRIATPTLPATPSPTDQKEALDYISKRMFNAHTGIVLHDSKVRFKTLTHTFLGALDVLGSDSVLKHSTRL